MEFEPVAGFPPLIREDDTPVAEKTLESRGFATTNIVKIADIMKTKQKENLYTAFGTTEEGAIDQKIQSFFDDKPHEYDSINYENIPKSNLIKLWKNKG